MQDKQLIPPASLPSDKAVTRLLGDLRALIESARGRVAQAANAGLVMLYWSVGRRIRRDILGDKRAEYGHKIAQTLSAQLTRDYGRGFSERNLNNMCRFAEVFPDPKIAHTVCAQLSWSKLRLIIYLEDDLKRDFYAELCRLEGWNVRVLQKKISGMLFERTVLSKKPAALARQELSTLRSEDKLTPDLVFRDPYMLDFLDLKDAYSEKDLEAAILRDLERFLVEFGTDFAFVARQKRVTVANKDRHIDLLFYHRGLRRLVAIELKLGDFEPEHVGQMAFYLRWLEKHDVRPGEEPPIGLILCAGKEHEDIELLQLDKSGIRVAEYMTELPPRGELEKKLRQAISAARERFAAPRG